MYITYKKKYMTDVEKCEINVTVGKVQKMKCKIKGSVNMKLTDEQMVKLTKVLYMPQAVENLLSLSRLVSKGTTVGDTQDKTIIKKKGVSIILYARKGQKKIMMFYLKAKRYSPEGQE